LTPIGQFLVVFLSNQRPSITSHPKEMGNCLSPAGQTTAGAAKKDGNWTHVTNSPLSPTEILR
jgi:hypothetical protein